MVDFSLSEWLRLISRQTTSNLRRRPRRAKCSRIEGLEDRSMLTAPVAVADVYSVNEDTTLNGSTVLANDTDADGDTIDEAVLDTTTTNGTLTLNTDGTFTYVPNPNFNGVDSFTYFARDSANNENSLLAATVTITVDAIDDLPVAVDDTLTVAEDSGTTSGDLAANDTPSGDGGNVWSLDTAATSGVAVVNADGTFTYTPNANFNGSDSFTYSITDADGDTSIATVSITVTAVDDTPIAVDDTLTVAEDSGTTLGDLAINDTPSGDGGNVWTLTTAASNGIAVVNADGTFTYTPDANFNGSDSFTYTITDADGDTSTATVAITVTSVDDLPIAVADTLTVDEDSGTTSGDLAANDTPSGDGGNVWSLTTAASSGVAVVNADGTFTYTPNANFNGLDSFTYTITDADGDTSTAIVAITVNSVDDVPVAVDDTLTVAEDSGTTSGDLAANDTPSGDGGNVWSLDTAATNGVAVVNADGTFTYTPNANFNGSDSFTYSITDADGDTSIATVAITVTAVDDAPVAVDDTLTVAEDSGTTSGDLAANDTPSGDGGNVWSLTTGAIGGVAAVNADGTFTYTPNANFNGSDSFTYTITDADGDTSTATVAITVTSVDDLPVAVADTLAVDEDSGTTSGDLAANDTPSGDGGNVWSLTTAAVGGVAVVNADGTFTYTPNANFNGLDSFSYTITDADGDTSSAVVAITVTAIDDVPLAVDDALTVAEDSGTTSGDLAANDTPSGDGGNVWSLDTAASNGVAVVNVDGTFSYTPNANFNGADSFTYSITDADGDTSIATVAITVTAVDDAPVAVDDALTVAEDSGTTSGNLAANDTPSGDGGNVWSLATAASNGVAVVNINGTFTYTPNANFNGADSFTYSITDADGDTSSATVSITVTSVDDVPVAVDDALTVAEDSGTTGGNLAANDTPSGDGGNVWSLTTAALGGVAVVNANGTFTYTPNANFNGLDSFSYTITDADGDTSTAIVSITVTSVDDLPVAVDDTLTVAEDSGTTSGDLAANDTPSGDGGNVWTLTTAASNGIAVVNANGTFTYTPNANFNGADSFTYTITDADGDMSTATVAITVTADDDAPIAVNDTLTVAEDSGTTSGNLAANDTPSGDGGNVWSLTTGAVSGVAVVNANGTFTYTPNANFNGSDSFTYTITDVDGDTSTASVAITVTSVDDVPVAVNDTLTVAEDSGTTSGNLAANDTPSGDGGNVWSLTTGAANGIAVVNANGTFTYTPNANFSGSDSFTYTITDVDGDTSSATVSITVTATDDLPLAVNDTLTVAEDSGATSGNLATNDTPSADGGNVWSLTTAAANGVAVVNANGTFTYTPNANFNGLDSFTYTITDADGDMSTATVAITVTAVNDAPVVVDGAGTLDEDTTFNGSLSPLGMDVEGNALTFTAVTQPTNGTLTLSPDGTFIYTPDADFSGTDSFTFMANDGLADSNVATFTLTVNELFVLQLSTTPGTIATSKKTVVPLDPTASLINISPSVDFSNASITAGIITGGDKRDKIVVTDGVGGGGTIDVRGKKIRFNGTEVARLSGGRRGNPLQVDFNSSATLDAVNAVLQRIGVRTSKRAATTTRTIEIQVSAGGGTSTATIDANVV